MVVNICLISTRPSCSKTTFSLNALVHYSSTERSSGKKESSLIKWCQISLLGSSVRLKFWVRALSTAIYLINRLPTQHLNFDLPYFSLYDMHPGDDMLYIFGDACLIHLPLYEHHKIATQSKLCTFMGYNMCYKSYFKSRF